MTGKFVGYFRLVDASAQPGCPVCRCLAQDGRRYLEALLWEQVNDFGFGAAIISEDLVRLFSHRVVRLRERVGRARRGPGSWLRWIFGRAQASPLVRLYRRRPMCTVCVTATAAEGRHLCTMLAGAGLPLRPRRLPPPRGPSKLSTGRSSSFA